MARPWWTPEGWTRRLAQWRLTPGTALRGMTKYKPLKTSRPLFGLEPGARWLERCEQASTAGAGGPHGARDRNRPVRHRTELAPQGQARERTDVHGSCLVPNAHPDDGGDAEGRAGSARAADEGGTVSVIGRPPPPPTPANRGRGRVGPAHTTKPRARGANGSRAIRAELDRSAGAGPRVRAASAARLTPDSGMADAKHQRRPGSFAPTPISTPPPRGVPDIPGSKSQPKLMGPPRFRPAATGIRDHVASSFSPPPPRRRRPGRGTGQGHAVCCRLLQRPSTAWWLLRVLELLGRCPVRLRAAAEISTRADSPRAYTEPADLQSPSFGYGSLCRREKSAMQAHCEQSRRRLRGRDASVMPAAGRPPISAALLRGREWFVQNAWSRGARSDPCSTMYSAGTVGERSWSKTNLRTGL